MIPDEVDTESVKESKEMLEMIVILCPECYGTYSTKCKICKGRQMLTFTEAIIQGIPLEKCDSNTFTMKELIGIREEAMERDHGHK